MSDKPVTTLSHAEWMDILENMGIYPAAVRGGDGAYEERTDFMEGWNAAIMDMTHNVADKLKEKQNV